MTAEEVGRRAAATSFDAAATAQDVRAAAARVDQAWSAFLPRVSATGRYTRFSQFTPPALSAAQIVATPAASGTLNPAPTVAESVSLPLVLDNYLLEGSVVVPISDYLLRITKNYSAATRSREAAAFDSQAAYAKAGSDGRNAFYSWLRAMAAQDVAVEALADQKTHLADAQRQFDVGAASKADVLRAATNVASAEFQVVQAKDMAELAEEQVRVAMHAPDDEVLAPGESMGSPMPRLVTNLGELLREAYTSRPEIKSIDANAESARQQVGVARANYYPALSGFADGIYANPNPRQFPPSSTWLATWDAGLLLTWSPNDVVFGSAKADEALATWRSIEEKRGSLRDRIRIEVVQAYQAVREADFAIESTARELESATEAYKVAGDLFNAGKATSTTLTDAESELTRARLDVVNADANERTTRVTLNHVLGRDLPPVK